MNLNFISSSKSLFPRKGAVFVIGTLASFKKGFHKPFIPEAQAQSFREMLKSPALGRTPLQYSSLTGVNDPYKVVISILPDKVSKDNSPSRREWIYQQLEGLEAEERGLVI
ncbi:MAG: hypothetical protein EOP09_13450, partial [Proteobacteria bacterium]